MILRLLAAKLQETFRNVLFGEGPGRSTSQTSTLACLAGGGP